MPTKTTTVIENDDFIFEHTDGDVYSLYSKAKNKKVLIMTFPSKELVGSLQKICCDMMMSKTY